MANSNLIELVQTEGMIVARDQNNQVIALEQGDVLLDGTTILVASGAKLVVIEQGQLKEITGNQFVTIENETTQVRTAQQDDFDYNVPDDIDTILAALNAGVDPTQLDEAEAPAAGETGSALSDAAVVDRNNDAVLASAGYDTSPLIPTDEVNPDDVDIGVISTIEIDVVYAEGDDVRVSEEGLGSGLTDNQPVELDTTDNAEAVDAATVTISGIIDTITFDTGALNALSLTSGGEIITWVQEDDAVVGYDAVGYINDTDEVIRISLDVRSSIDETTILDVTTILSQPLDHEDTSVEDVLSFDVPLIVSNDLGGTATASVVVSVEDDMPADVADSGASLSWTRDGDAFMPSAETFNIFDDVLPEFGADRSGSVSVTIGDFQCVLEDGALTFIDPSSNLVSSTDTEFTLENDAGVYTLDMLTGDLHYEASPQVQFAATQTPVVVNYEITDTDGDSTQGEFTLTVTPTIDVDVDVNYAEGDDVRLSEEGLDNGIPDSLPDTQADTTNNTSSMNATISVSANGGVPVFDISELNTLGLESGGVPLSWALDIAGDVVGYIDNDDTDGDFYLRATDTEVIRLEISAGLTDGVTTTYEVTTSLYQPLDHDDDLQEDTLTFKVPFIVGNSTESQYVAVTVEDDMPDLNARSLVQTIEPVLEDTNLMILLDVSGSMNSSNAKGEKFWEVAEASIKALIAEYANSANELNIKVVAFDGSGQSWHVSAYGADGWVHVDSTTPESTLIGLYDTIDALKNGGSTNYDAALDLAQTEFATVVDNGYQNELFFISDGKPHPKFVITDGDLISEPDDESAWTAFLDENGIISRTFDLDSTESIPTGEDETDHDQIAYDGGAPGIGDGVNTDTSGIELSTAELLTEALIGELGYYSVDGGLSDLLVSYGADGEGIIYVDTDRDGNDEPYNSTDGIISITTEAGQTVKLDLSSGEYEYRTDDKNFTSDSFDIKFCDADGDWISTTITLNRSAKDSWLILNSGSLAILVASASTSDGAIDLSGYTGPEPVDILEVGTGETLILTADDVNSIAKIDIVLKVEGENIDIASTDEWFEATDQSTVPHGYVRFEATDGTLVDIQDGVNFAPYYYVEALGSPLTGTDDSDVIFGSEGDDLISAGIGNDLIFGGEGNDTIYGGEGDDTIYGGGGNDLIYGGAGNDIMAGGEGDDIFVWTMEDLGGIRSEDTITDFDIGSDSLDLRDLLPDTVTSSSSEEVLSQYLNIEDDLPDATKMHISSSGAFDGLSDPVEIENAADLTIELEGVTVVDPFEFIQNHILLDG